MTNEFGSKKDNEAQDNIESVITFYKHFYDIDNVLLYIACYMNKPNTNASVAGVEKAASA